MHEQKNSLAMARLCEQRGEIDAAEKLYHECIERGQESATAYHRLAVLAAEQGNLDQALAYFEQALDMAPPSTELLSDLGYCHYLRHDLEAAEQVLRDALQSAPNDQAICNNLALVCCDTGRFEEALRLFKRVNTEAEAYSNLGYAYAQAGEFEKSEEFYSRALSVDESLQVAAQAMLQVAQRQQQIEQANPTAEPAEMMADNRVEMPATQPHSDQWQRQEDDGIQLASQNAPVDQSPQVVIEDGPLRWKSATGKPRTSVGFVDSRPNAAASESNATTEETESFLHDHPGTTIRDDQVRPISAEFTSFDELRFQTVQTAGYEQPVNQPATWPSTAPAADAPRPLPPIEAKPIPGRLAILDFPFVPKAVAR
ncbi:MAG: tetratricopeptide repeat protein [Planctomycetales bacterium]|nr:tetratricopeptide repeat protein [Planctomycetales bacterium]